MNSRMRNLLKILVSSLLILVSFPSAGQVDLETQRKLIEDFQKQQEAKKSHQKETLVSDEPTKEGDLAVLRQEMADARLAYETKKSNENRVSVGQTTVNYVNPLIKLRDYDRATEALVTSIRLVGGQDNLSQLLVEVYLAQSENALEGGDYYTANRLLSEAWTEAKASRVRGLEETMARRFRDFYWDWAQVLFGQ